MLAPTFLRRIGFAALLVAIAFAVPSQAAAAPGQGSKKPITAEAYDGWRSIRDTTLSPNGEWLVYALVAQDGDGEVVARNLKTGREWRHPRGHAPAIALDGRFLAFAIAPSKAEMDKAKKEKKKPEDMPKAGLGVMDLATGQVTALDRVKTFRLPKEGGRFLAALLERPEAKKDKEDSAETRGDASDQRTRAAGAGGKDSKAKEAGTDLILWELETGVKTTIPDVAEYLWSRNGDWLAFAVSVKEAPKTKGEKANPSKGNIRNPADEGVYRWQASDGKIAPLLAGPGTYKALVVDESGTRLAFLSNRDDAKAEAPAFKLFGWKVGEPGAQALAGSTTAGMPEGWAPSEHGALAFSKDGMRLFLGTAPAPKAEPKDGPEPLNVDLWHWKDAELQPMQKVRAEEERKRSFRAVVHLADRVFVQLGSEEMPDLETNENGRVALGFAPGRYLRLASWDQAYADAFAIDLRTGAKIALATKLPWSRRSADGPGRPSHLSPGGRYLYYFNPGERAWMQVPTTGGAAVNLTKNVGVAFQQEDHDTPDLAGAYGSAGWTKDDGAFLAYDRFDLWELKPGGARNLTGGEGRRQRMALRYLRLDPEEPCVPEDRPLILLAVNENTKATAFFRQDWKPSAPVRLLGGDELLGGLQKAKKADVVAFTRQRFDVFPDLWSCDLAFAKPVRASQANPQQADYRWGTQELMEYTNADGKVLKALVTKPENFDPKRKYPLMVYIYEKYSDRLHNYQAPAPGTSINFSRYASNGYVILRPDIVYEIGHPGQSAVKCVLPAIEKLAQAGFVDRDRIGIQGHSWGAYQVAYLVGQTNLFKAAEAGAPVANMTSAYGGIRWGTGMSRAFQYEKTQSRMGATPWERPLLFLENSPLFGVERIQTPLLMIHNDGDDAVPWYQGIELFSALRRLDKPVWMFNFNGDKHNLAQRENQKYWTLHLDEFFDHLLLGAPRPDWMDRPVPYLERGKRGSDKKAMK